MSMDRKSQLASRDFWGELFALRDQQRERQRTALQVVERDMLPLENNAHGMMRWYMHPAIHDTVISTLLFYEQEIPPQSRSGRLKFQGGQIMYILEGRGHTLINGVAHHWEADDVVNLPLRKEGLIVEHVNDDPITPVRFLATEVNWFDCVGVDRGCGFEQLATWPGYQKTHGDT